MKKFETHDLALAAFLSYSGREIVSIKQLTKSQSAITFSIKDGDTETIRDFFNRKCRVEPVSYLDHQRSLKAMIGGA